jgi:pyruvate dehydrogenase E1 component
MRQGIIDGAYWMHPPGPRADLAIVYCGAIAPEAIEAHAALLDDIPGAGLLAVTSPGRLHADWMQAQREGRDSRIGRLMAPLASDAILVTILDGHPSALSWIGAASGCPVQALGVERFGQSGDLHDLYQAYALDADAILDAVARGCQRRRGT